MSIKRPDLYEHNNPNSAIADSNSVRGGGRVVDTIPQLYALAPKVDQLKEFVTTAYVKTEKRVYRLVSIANVGNALGWALEFDLKDYYTKAEVDALLEKLTGGGTTPTPTKIPQSIAFSDMVVKYIGDADFSPGAVATSGLVVTYDSSDQSVATIVGGLVHIVSAGSTIITAKQSGDTTYSAAPSISKLLIVNGEDSNTFPLLIPITFT